MAERAGRQGRESPVQRPGPPVRSEGRRQDLSDKREVEHSFSDLADLSRTIQDPDERPAIHPQVSLGGLGGGEGGGPGLPRTGGDDIDLSGIGRSTRDTRQTSPKPGEAEKDTNKKILPTAPKPQSLQQLDISQYKNPDGSYDLGRLQAVVSTRIQTGIREARAARRAKRPFGARRPAAEMKPLETAQATRPRGRAEEVRPSQAAPRRPKVDLRLSPIAEKSSLGSKEMESPKYQNKTVSPRGSVDLETGERNSGEGKQVPVEKDEGDGSAAWENRNYDQGSLYGASPPRTSVQTRPTYEKNSSTTSPGQGEKYRRWAAEPAESPTIEQKFKEWVDRGESSKSKTAAQEREAWAQKDILDAHEKHLAWLFEQRSKSSSQLKIESDKIKRKQLQNIIDRCTLIIKEAIKLEDKRQSRETFKENIELETNPLLKRKLEERLQKLNREIELDEKVERVRIEPHMRPDSVWQKAWDMTPAERATLDVQARQHFMAPAQQSPMMLRESFAEQLLRDQWEREDASDELEDLYDRIGAMSDSEERDTYWESLQDLRRPILLQRNKQLADLWKVQADEVEANRQDTWLESEAKAEERLLKLHRLDKPKSEEEKTKKSEFSAALAATVAKKKAEDAEVEKQIEDIEGLPETEGVSQAKGQRERIDFPGLVAALRGGGVTESPELSIQDGKSSERLGLLSVRTASAGTGVSGGRGIVRPVNVSLASGDSGETAPQISNSKFEEETEGGEWRISPQLGAEGPFSSIQEQRSGAALETDPAVANFLEYAVLERGEGELVGLDEMREKLESVMSPDPIDVAGQEMLEREGKERKDQIAQNSKDEVEKKNSDSQKDRSGNIRNMPKNQLPEKVAGVDTSEPAGQEKEKQENKAPGKSLSAEKTREAKEKAERRARDEEDFSAKEGDTEQSRIETIQAEEKRARVKTEREKRVRELQDDQKRLKEILQDEDEKLAREERRRMENAQPQEARRAGNIAGNRGIEDAKEKKEMERLAFEEQRKKLAGELRDKKERERRERRERIEEVEEEGQQNGREAVAAKNSNERVKSNAYAGLFQTIFRGIDLPDLSWLTLTGPERLKARSEDEICDHSSLATPSPIPADYELSPETLAWIHDRGDESLDERKISLNLTIFTSPTQHFLDAPPPHYLACHDIPVAWHVSQLQRYISAVIRGGGLEEKTIRLRIERRWLDDGSKTLREEGFQDWESVLVVMVGEGEDMRKGDWIDCVLEADGVAGWRDGRP